MVGSSGWENEFENWKKTRPRIKKAKPCKGWMTSQGFAVEELKKRLT
jgi:hypothetical protein